MNDEKGKAMKTTCTELVSMTFTNEERREVAERLRNLAGHIAADEELTLDALGLYRGENIEGYDTYGVMHLADLIDPT